MFQAHMQHASTVRDSTCLHASKSLCTLTVKALLIILPEHSLIESRQCWGSERLTKQHEDAAHKDKNHENKILRGSLKRLGAPGKHPLFPSPPQPIGGPVASKKKEEKVIKSCFH